MGKITFQQSISLDGFSAGPNQSLEEPLGVGGESLHEWVVALDVWRQMHGMDGGERTASSAIIEEVTTGVGAHIMGRNMFGGGPGPWGDDQWKGWWGDNPPFHVPVFVLTHYEREPLILEGGNEFHFVTEGPERALELARTAAGDRDIAIAGGAKAVQQFLRMGVVDEFWVHETPVVLGSGSRFFDDVFPLSLRQISSIAGNGVTHLKYEVVR
ncbi:MAG: dihydrofolate reductase family protein [Thermomicrobiales bacterium]|nr:dihydrofolate reductase family protein [Thermomicrobiales bacterium]